MVQGHGPVLGGPIGLEVRQGHIAVLLDYGPVDIVKALALYAMVQSVQGPAYLLVMLIVLYWAVARALDLLHLACGHAKEQDVLVAHGLVYLHVGPVQGADGEGAVYHKLHIAGAAGLCARKGYLLAYLGGGYKGLGPGDAVVLHEDNLHLLVHPLVVVYNVRKGAYKLYDLLGEIVPRRGLCPKEPCVRRKVGVGIVQQPLICGKYRQRVHMLALILVQALHLHIEDGVRVHHKTLGAPEVLRKALLILVLYTLKPLKNRAVVLILQKVRELIRVVDIVLPDKPGDKLRQLRVRLAEPAPMGNAVCDVRELCGLLHIEVVEQIVL